MIRPYDPADRDALYAICIRTGDAGRDATALYRDPRILPDIFTGPYLHLEPELAFVLADPKDRPVGYIVGTADTLRFVAAYKREWAPRVAGRYPQPRDQSQDKDAERIHQLHHPEWMLRDDLASYPAHLHIALLPQAQGQGAGRTLISVFLSALRSAGVPAVHLSVNAANTNARAFYHRCGFHQIADFAPARILMGRQVNSANASDS